MNKPSHQAADEAEEKAARRPASAERTGDKGDDDNETGKPASLLEMLFREAEVIARNLKESGTRR